MIDNARSRRHSTRTYATPRAFVGSLYIEPADGQTNPIDTIAQALAKGARNGGATDPGRALRSQASPGRVVS